MSTMVERLARAIYEKRNGAGCRPWSIQTKVHKAPYLDDARAAIEAIIPFVSDMPPARLIRISDTDPGRIWDIAAIAQHRAIVDYLQAALKEQA